MPNNEDEFPQQRTKEQLTQLANEFVAAQKMSDDAWRAANAARKEAEEFAALLEAVKTKLKDEATLHRDTLNIPVMVAIDQAAIVRAEYNTNYSSVRLEFLV